MEKNEGKKDILEKMFRSVFGNRTDAENSEALPDREEIDKNVEKMLKMLHTEGNGADSSENSFDKSELASLIDDFHKAYQAVYERYELLMGNLQKKIQPRNSDKGSFSTDLASTSFDSEDSDSGSDSDKKKLSKVKEGKAGRVSLEDYQNLQQQLEDMKIKYDELETQAIEVSTKFLEQTLVAELSRSAKILQAELDFAKKESEVPVEKGDDMNQKMRILHEENDYLKFENAEAFRRIHEADKSIDEFQTELNEIKDEMVKCKSENSILKEEVGKTSSELASLNEQLMSVTEEKEALRSGNFVFLKRVQEAEKALAALTDEAGSKLKLVTEEFTSQNANLSSENESLKLRLEAATQHETYMAQRLSAVEEEISSLKSEILRSSILIQEAEKTIGDLTTLRDENSKLLKSNNELNQQLEVKVAEVEALSSARLEAVEELRKAEEKTSTLSVEMQTLKDENSKLLVDYDKIKHELDETNSKVFVLKWALESTEDEKQTLIAENSALSNSIQQAKKTIDDLRAETERQGEDKSQLQIKITDLGLELEAAKSQLSDLSEELCAAKEEKNAFALEISGFMVKLQKTKSNRKELENELEHSMEEISSLQRYQMEFQEAEKIIDDLEAEVEQLRALRVDNSELNTKISTLGVEIEALNLQLTGLNGRLVCSEDEKKKLVSETLIVASKLQQVAINVGKLKNNVMQMADENSALHSKLQETEKVMNEHKNEIQQLRDDRIQLETKINGLSCELEAANFQLVNLKKAIEAAEEEKTSLTSEFEMAKVGLQQVEVTVQNLEAGMGKLQEENAILENNYNELPYEKNFLAEKLEEKEKEIRNLQENCNELVEKLQLKEIEKTDEARENAKLSKKVQTMEVQLRLSSQRLKITETESKEKVEGCMWTMEIMKDERRSIEEQMLKLSQKLYVLETNERQLKEAAEAWMSGLAKGYSDLEADFERNSGIILEQLSTFTEELKALEKWIAELRHEKRQLTIRLRYKESIMSLMKDQKESISSKLAKNEKELDVLRAHTIECVKKMGMLEEMLGQKEKELSDKDEAKREVIRQLCFHIEYHRENSDHLRKYLSSVLKRRRRSSS